MAIFFTFSVVVVDVVGSELRKVIYGLDQGEYIKQAMRALRPTDLLPPPHSGFNFKHPCQSFELTIRKNLSNHIDFAGIRTQYR